jgi:hypothetical protein
VIRWAAAEVVKGRSIRSLVMDLNARGVPSPTGATWRDRSLRKTLTSPRIAGLRPVGTKDAQGRDRVPDADHQATWEAIVSREEWERVRAILATTPRGAKARSFLLAGRIFCGSCGRRMQSHVSRTGDRNRRRYRCVKGEDPGACGRMAVEAAQVENVVAISVIEAAQGADLAMVRAEHTVSERARLAHEVADDEQMLADLSVMHANRKLTSLEWRTQRDIIEARLKTNRDRLTALGHADQPIPPGLNDLTDTSWAALGFDARRAVVGLFVERVTILPSRTPGRFDLRRVRINWLRD